MGRYQERSHWSNYHENRKKVCEIYEVDENEAQVHHIIARFDCLKNLLFRDFDLNQESNLYPFTDDERGREQHTTKRDHADLHAKIDKREPRKVGKSRRGKKKKRKKKRRRR